MRKPFAAIVCLSLCAVIAPAQGGKGKGEPKVEGSWAPTSLMFDDKKLPAEVLEELMFTFKEGKYTFLVMGKQDEAGSYKIDAKMKPAHIDLMIEEGKDKGKTQVGLITVDGDTLKMALARPGEKDRPKDFEGGMGFVVATVKRSK